MVWAFLDHVSVHCNVLDTLFFELEKKPFNNCPFSIYVQTNNWLASPHSSDLKSARVKIAAKA